MENDWQAMTIAECALKEPYATQIGAFGSAILRAEYTPSGVPVIRGVNVNHGRFHDDDFVFISGEKAEQLHKYESYPGDVLLVHRGTLGKIGLMPKTRKYHRYILGNSMLRVRCDETILLSEYLYYWLSSPKGQNYLFSRISQVGVPAIPTPLATLRQATLLVPPLQVQKSITNILSMLDNRIELSEQINKTLEEIGKAIFKHWFVDFEFPNKEGKPYKSSGGEMVYNDVFAKEIPKDWKVGIYSDLVEVTTGKGLHREEFVADGEFPVLGANGELGRTNKYLFGEYLVLTGRVGTLGSVYMVRDKVWISDNVLISRARSKDSFYYAYFTIKNFDLKSLNRGSTQPLITQTDLKNQIILNPNKSILAHFDFISSSIFNKIFDNNQQINTLSQIRELLLPRLMSGKIRVPVEAQ